MSQLTESRGSRYSDEDRRNAVMLYTMKGSLSAVQRECGIPKQTLSAWKREEWWQEVAQQAEALVEEKIRAGANSIVDKCIEQTLDRVEHGDYILTKEGTKHRVPMKGRDTAVIGAMWYDKRRLSLNLPTSIADNSGHKKVIEGLVTEFRQLSEAYREKRINSISGECEDLTDRPKDQVSST